MRRYVLLLFIFNCSVLLAQYPVPDVAISLDLDQITVFTEYDFKDEKEKKEYETLEKDLSVIYPMLIIVRNDYSRINKELELYEGDREKKFMKWYEKYAKENYMPYLGALNVRQGRLFLKMISRELQTTPYEIIKEYRNRFSAVVWQVVANFYLSNLKTEYSAESNPMIEHIMKRLEMENS